MNFEESVNYLYSLGNEVLAMKLGLENIEKVLNAIGNPQNNFLKVQVAGTNGKGSTCAFLDAICRSAEIKTGLYTSPHLISITERIKIDGEEISENEFAKHANIVRKISENLVETGELEAVPTFFEQITAIAISAFGEANIELGILETGLGGRFDATTATNAEIVAITPIDYDHQQILGNTLTEIAGEKAAIIRADTKVIISKQHPEVEKVILERCEQFGVKPIRNCRWFEEDSNEYYLITKKSVYSGNLSLKGNHQLDNACVAVDLAELLAKEFGFKQIGREEIDKGLQTAIHKGRLEFYQGILFDGAHNLAGAKALREYLESTYQPLIIVFGAMKDKDLEEIAQIIFPLASDLILTQPQNPRSATVEELKEIALKFLDKDKIFSVPNVSDAVDSAKQISEVYQTLVCVTGSLYLVGEAQKSLNKKVY